MLVNTDIDIDVSNRDSVLKILNAIPALGKDGKKHNVGVYFQNIPKNPLTSISNIDFKTAEDLGYFKIDILNNHVYEDIKDEEHLDKLINTEPLWELLEHKEVVEQLVHIHNYHNIVSKIKPKSIEQLAMVLAMIRPAKKHLIDKSWEDIEKDVWVKPTDDSYYFKKPHAISYAVSIVVQLNRLVEKLTE